MIKSWRRSAWALALAGSLGVTGSAPGLSQGFLNLSEQEELEIGKQASEEIEKQEPILQDSAVQSYLDGLGQQLVRFSGRSDIPYSFKVVDAADVNAFALPGGYIYVNRGLIRAADNESELAGVLAHEIGHVVGRHSAEQVRKLQLTGLGLGILGAILGDKGRGGQIAAVASQLVATGVFLKFSREAEREADRLGAQNLYDARYDPRGMVTLFDKLAQMRQSRPNAVEAFFSSHPDPAERAENVNDLIASFPNRSNLRRNSADFDRIKRRLDRLPPPVKGSADASAPGQPGPDRAEPTEAPATYRGQWEDAQLASIHAPELVVGLSNDPWADLPTRVDFDGDWDSSNNAQNAGGHSYRAPAYVYYGASETETHFFLTYTLYFPFNNETSSRPVRRDTRSNDLESCLVVVEKRDRDDARGRVVLVEVLGEDGPERFVPGAALLGGFGNLRLEGDRVRLYVDPRGHRISAFTGDPTQSSAPGGVLYYGYAGRAEEPRPGRSDRVGYDLLPLYDLWQRGRSNPDPTYGELYDFGSISVTVADARGRSERRSVPLGRVGTALQGEERYSRAGSMPWGYRDGRGATGSWFIDPAAQVRAQFNLSPAFSTSYVHHPFLEVLR